MIIKPALYESIKRIMEAPLPDDWDKDIYNPRISFKKRVEYAKQRASRLGQGSARVAFEIPYEGRQTVLKIAKNKKGMAQNEAEADVLSDGYLRHSPHMIPIIDYDETSNEPTWIHMEKAEPVKSYAQLTKLLHGFNIYTLYDHAKRGESVEFSKELKKENLTDKEKEELFAIYDLFVSLKDVGVNLFDFMDHHNWGIYKGKPVVVDVGFTDEVAKAHYSR